MQKKPCLHGGYIVIMSIQKIVNVGNKKSHVNKICRNVVVCVIVCADVRFMLMTGLRCFGCCYCLQEK